ncbi:hypothetical protein J2X56_001191 [Herbaspirillum sp. 1173]|uniref:glycosyltransferase family 39 protein n=1 Tax=Herbaspirillum sp. 1173 TaxID=2817734 RepID=UPI0028595F95|nr:glycosyltransferase family 39 protein [Herbaspirillum sp. 1173]MDR6739205.1 hypothetical protein [Herbaspirillum sp. 1173]
MQQQLETYRGVAEANSTATYDATLIRHKRFLCCYIFVYVIAWTSLTFSANSTVPGGDAIEAFNWATNLDWGTPRSGWAIGLSMYPALFFESVTARSFYWYFAHFCGVGIGVWGVWALTFRLTHSQGLAWLAVLLLHLTAIINTDAQNQNDNFLLIMTWPWMFYFFIRAGFDDHRFWLAFAGISGVATMAKYSSLAFVGSVFLLTLASPKLRSSWRSQWFYLAIACFIAMVIPNVVWLWEHEFVAINWFVSDAHRGLAFSTIESALMVFTNAWLPYLVFRLMRVPFRWPVLAVQRCAILCMLLPLIPITLYLVFFPTQNPSRITEWLIPFSILAPPLLMTCVSNIPMTLVRRASIVLVIAGAIVFIGYAIAKLFNVGNTYYSGHGEAVISAQGQDLWKARYSTKLRYVGGSAVAGVATFYASDLPAILMQWSSATQPNIFTRDLSLEKVSKYGALLFGEPGEPCRVADFTKTLANWPGMRIDILTELPFAYSPSAAMQPICLAFVAPGAQLISSNITD